MEETMMNSTTEEYFEEQAAIAEEDRALDTTEKTTPEKDPLKQAIEEQMRKIQRQSMLIGAQTMCRVVLDKVLTFKTKQGKPTMNDYKRLVKDIQNFCETGLSRKVNADGETEPVENSTETETVQN